MTDNNSSKQSIPDKGFFGQPRGLSTLFFTEFWERFSYYGMKAILAYYLYYSVTKGGFGLEQSTALQIVSIYGALIYMSGIIGGWLADRVFGIRHSIFYGGILIMLGHILLALPNNFTVLMIALLLLIIGTGLLKPNISTNVGMLYEKDDPRVDSGFTLFYMSINLGSLISPLLVGTLQVKYGFHAGFALAAVGMFFGLLTYVITNKKNLGDLGLKPSDPLKAEEKKKFGIIAAVTIIAIVLFITITLMTNTLTIGAFANFITFLGVILPTVLITKMILSKKVSKKERSHLFAYIPLFLASVVFWMIQEQGATVLAAFADTKTELSVANITNGLIDFNIPAAWFQSLNPLFIVFFAPIISRLWVKLGDRNPSTVTKFTVGVLLAGAAYLIMIVPLSTEGLIHPLWLVLSFFLVTIGELFVSPIGLSTTTRLAPVAFQSQMMSVWFLSNAMAQGLNAQMVKLYDLIDTKAYFMYLGSFAIIVAVILIILGPKIRKVMGNL
ncbi:MULTISPECIES: peptide MFS transporter [Nosocomiicoccus]|uniref:Oligopeptide:H+ symporter n=1 Tax=Nosocomiicoccus massiliensis TaxID=1232430 RepID=A0AAF0YHN6_9STAP|nr:MULTISPECIES: oligopeptide:H+ symporter [Nosocomiicoccus]MDK6862780.1 oligopeptide:H+ symporter [Nosocomiicoccus ampullae]OFL47305.1 peptide transporter [Nosocomiicoccus sp. HMSC067E10]OFO49066.1 peptide transporter [Nosocomiicoccus sp. HMSC059G07]OFS63107.1 peptide transporter [Nosocomiicoccus sp. HMSC09A07]WOS95640.1 oligopeptide:H+ symporter [Nosocomiicoccus massiliensis]